MSRGRLSRQSPGGPSPDATRAATPSPSSPPSIERGCSPLGGAYVSGHSAFLDGRWSDRGITPSDQDVSDEEVVDNGGDYAAHNRCDNRYPEVDVDTAVTYPRALVITR